MSEWITWDGTRVCPLRSSDYVEVCYWSGETVRAFAYKLDWGWTYSIKDIVAYRLLEIKDNVTEETEMNTSENWIEWDGVGERPVHPYDFVEVRLASGDALRAFANRLTWRFTGSSGDIVAYRLATPTPADIPSYPTPEPFPASEPSALGKQVAGDHYKKYPIQPVEYIYKNGLGFCEGSVVKYVTRWQDKGGLKDLEKAKHFIELLIEMEPAYFPVPGAIRPALTIPPAEYIHKNGIGFFEGSTVYFVTMWRVRNGTDDLRAARRHIDELIELETSK